MAYRRCAFLAIAITSYLFKAEIPTKATVAVCFLKLTGSILAGYESLDKDLIGFIVVWGCNFMGAFSQVLIAHLNKEKIINAYDTSFFFSFVGFLILAPYVVYSNNHHVLYDFAFKEGENHAEFFWLFGQSSVSGLIITIFTMIVISLGGPYAMYVTGNMRDVVLTYISFLIFDDLASSNLIIIGISMSFLGSLVFVASKMKEECNPKPPADEAKK